jgi:hypothetical protein
MKCSICKLDGHNKRTCNKKTSVPTTPCEFQATHRETTVSNHETIGTHTTSEDCISAEEQIMSIFEAKIKGRCPPVHSSTHCGFEGHWLERQFGVSANSSNTPDILGYEVKKASTKISFGDFSASEYLFSSHKPVLDNFNSHCEESTFLKRKEFITCFGMPNPLKNNRYSWSGKCVPKVGIWNLCGQTLRIMDNNDIAAIYSYNQDTRPEKQMLPAFLKSEKEIMIAIWRESKMKKHINNKFNAKGFIICSKKNGLYNDIKFGKAFNFEAFLDGLKCNKIIFDSGMYDGNSRNYSQFRSNMSNFWSDYVR